MPTFLLADDHTLIRQSLSQLLSNIDGYEVIAEASTGIEAVASILACKPDIAIIDQTMPTLSGVDVIKKSVDQNSETTFILLTMHEEPLLAIEAMQAGAAAFVLKGNDISVLQEAIVRVLKQEIYISPSFIPIIDQCQAEKLLSPREKEILIAVASGLSKKETSQLLNISTSTVDSYRSRISQKTQLKTIAELTHLAIRLGLC